MLVRNKKKKKCARTETFDTGVKMVKTRKLFFLLGALLATCYLIALFALNVWLPRGHHFLVYTASEKRMVESTLVTKLLMFRYLSGFMFKYTGNYCDLPKYSTVYEVDERKNFTISELVVASSDANSSDSNIVYAELDSALAKCDLNIAAEEQSFPPIFIAIYDANEKTVSLLLKHNVDLNNRLNRPGRKSDQTTPIEFARLLLELENTNEKKEALKNIIALLESHIQMSRPNVQ